MSWNEFMVMQLCLDNYLISLVCFSLSRKLCIWVGPVSAISDLFVL